MAEFKLLRWMQNLYQSALDYEGLSFVIMVTHRCCVTVKAILVHVWFPYLVPLYNHSNNWRLYNYEDKGVWITVGELCNWYSIIK
jgi:hypothetical protein